MGKGVRACLKTLGDRRVRARGLQDWAEKPADCRPGALTGLASFQTRSKLFAYLDHLSSAVFAKPIEICRYPAAATGIGGTSVRPLLIPTLGLDDVPNILLQRIEG